MANKLSIYNGALVLLGARKLASLSEPRESRRVLDSLWDNDFIDTILQHGLWYFAVKTIKLEQTDSLESQFGREYLYQLPSDFIKLTRVSLDEYQEEPYLGYRLEGEYIKCGVYPLYISYISNASNYGGDISRWTPTFTRYAEHYLALNAAETIGKFSENKMLRFEKDMKKKLLTAKSDSAMQQPTQFMPTGSWVKSRIGRDVLNGRRIIY